MYVGRSVGLSKGNPYKKYVCQKSVGGITWPKNAHAQSQLGAVNRSVTPVLFISTNARAALAWMKKKPNKNVHLEMRNLKQMELQRPKNRGKKGREKR